MTDPAHPYPSTLSVRQWEMYEQMYTIRTVEQRLLQMFDEGRLAGTVHTCLGQEACAVGIVGALQKDRDIVISNHRGHGHYLVHSGFDIQGLIGEVMGRAIGVCKGMGGSQQLHTPTFYSIGVQGGLVPAAAGLAFAAKRSDSGAIVSLFIGDGTMGQGIVYETMNLVSLWQLPILFVVESNGYAQTTPTSVQHAGNLGDRALPFGIDSTQIDVRDVAEVRDAGASIVESIRKTSRPHFLLLNTYRLGPHSKGDDHREPSEIAQHERLDPLNMLRVELATTDEAKLIDLEGGIVASVEAISESVFESPQSELTEILGG